MNLRILFAVFSEAESLYHLTAVLKSVVIKPFFVCLFDGLQRLRKKQKKKMIVMII